MFSFHRPIARAAAIAGLASLMLLPFGRADAATPNTPAPSVIVRYLSADLSTPQGVGVLYHRIREAASSVCGTYDRVLLEEKASRDKCVDEAVATAVANVHSERLSAHHWRRVHGKQAGTDPPTSLAVR